VTYSAGNYSRTSSSSSTYSTRRIVQAAPTPDSLLVALVKLAAVRQKGKLSLEKER
jgi:hypothetical protein